MKVNIDMGAKHRGIVKIQGRWRGSKEDEGMGKRTTSLSILKKILEKNISKKWRINWRDHEIRKRKSDLAGLSIYCGSDAGDRDANDDDV